jgi:sugar phosphate isomerase/epimerase
MPRTRREFLRDTTLAAAAALCPGALSALERARGDRMHFGLVTYMWGAKWTLPDLLAACEKAACLGVELRTTHAHGVETRLDPRARKDVKKRFRDSPVTLVGLGSNERFDDPDPAVVKKAIEATKKFVVLSHDVGATGVKVKPNSFHKDVPREKTIEQIGKSLLELGKFADGFGQEIRLEVHGQCAELPTIKKIVDIGKHPSVTVCWNSNKQGLQGKGLEHNFGLVRKRFGHTLHTRELDSKDYPYQQLINLLVKTDYEGWVMLESSKVPKDRVAALTKLQKLFETMVATAKKTLEKK